MPSLGIIGGVLIFVAIHWFQEFLGFRVPLVLAYTSTRMMLAALTSLLLCIFLGPGFIRKLYELKIGQSIRKKECPLLGELHSKKENTPTMGGILILFSMLVSLLLWMDLKSSFTLILLTATVALGCVGGIDPALLESPKYSQGYGEGCETAHQRTHAFSMKTVRDDSLFESDEAYRVGWRQGFQACSNQEPTAAPDDYFGDRRNP